MTTTQPRAWRRCPSTASHTSDLSAKHFIHRILTSSALRHMKLDLKWTPSNELSNTCTKFPDSTQTILSDADILPGPGKYPSDIINPLVWSLSNNPRCVLLSILYLCCFVLASPSLSHTRNDSISLFVLRWLDGSNNVRFRWIQSRWLLALWSQKRARGRHVPLD